jgi:hypothetical protein
MGNEGPFEAEVSGEAAGDGFEVEFGDIRAMTLFKLLRIRVTVFRDGLLEIDNVLKTFLELSGADLDDFHGRDTKVLNGGKVGGFANVEPEGGMGGSG